MHTSYWREFGGGYRKSDTFIERAKSLIDSLHAWHSRDNESLRVDYFTKSTRGIHFYDSVVVFEKDIVSEPTHEQRGKQALSILEGWNYLASKTASKNIKKD